MTMGDKNLYGKLIVDVVICPVLEKLERKDISAAQTLRSAISKAESKLPGLTYDLVRGLLQQAELADKMDLCQTLLRLGGVTETEEIRIPRSEAIYRELNDCSVDLKRILGRIPEQIYDRKQFLETIKEIASSIKTLLDAVNKVIAEMPPHMVENGTKQVLEDRKKEFVRYSKKFSNTLKEYFRDTSLNQSVFLSANHLIHQTNLILKTVRQDVC
ncbi:programmed cell death protein 10-like [Pomacea canaliculata]|uniref:programmed cell death protein 10-like n=1 Tax=Pomacea canaliculata TaxID=400727 RepID=UPI000D72BA89|nr:programmed cell death protein 10-like [Pomacea canaliculata]